MATLARARLVAAMAFFCLIGACATNSRSVTGEKSVVRGDAKLIARLDQVLRRGQSGSAFYVARVVDLKTGQELYAVDADKPVMPASNGKLAVGAAALDFFGPGATFKTYLAMDGDDLWLIGTGDPGIGDSLIAKKYGRTTTSVLDDWADALAQRGVKSIKGNLYYYDRAFEDQWIHPSWGRNYITDWYAAPISGLNFNNNCVDISLKPTKTGEPVSYTVVPQTQDAKVIIKCVTGSGDEPDVDRQKDTNVFTVTGATTKPVTLKGEAVTNPGAFFADALRTHLASRGITIAGATTRADKPLDGPEIPRAGKIVAVHETKFPDALGRVNKQSQNNFAEGLCKLLGKAYMQKQGRDEPGSWEAGAQATRAFLHRNNIDTSGTHIVDGSGLSRKNRVTAQMISDIFVTMWKHRHKDVFFNSLTISGTDGTIKERLTDLTGRVHAKTGFIGGVRSLSGYVQNDDGHWIAFSIIYNGFRGSAKPFEHLQDNAVRVLAAWPRQIDLPTTRATTTVVER